MLDLAYTGFEDLDSLDYTWSTFDTGFATLAMLVKLDFCYTGFEDLVLLGYTLATVLHGL